MHDCDILKLLLKYYICVTIISWATILNAQTTQAPASQAPAEIQGNQIRFDWKDSESPLLSNVQNYIEGFTPVLTWQGEQWSNLSGGKKAGTSFDYLLTFGFTQDISALSETSNLGEIGATFFNYAATKDFDHEYLGDITLPSNIFSSDMFRVYEIFYALSLDIDCGKISTRIGQLAADEDFMGLDCSDIFLNSNFGAIPACAGIAPHNGATAFSQYSLATLGMTLSFDNDDFDAKIGIYNGNCGNDTSTNHGFGYPLQYVALWYQIGAKYKVFDKNGIVRFGGNYNSGKFAYVDLSDKTERNFYSFYLEAQQDIVTQDDGAPKLAAFCRFAISPDEKIADFSGYFDAGINWFAPINTRRDDIFALGISMGKTTHAFADVNANQHYDTVLEATYRLMITPAIELQPSFQIYFDAHSETGESNAAYLIGTRLTVNF